MSALTSHAETANEDLMKQLECPICMEYCVPPIYMCIKGHNVCSSCRENLKECAICREPGKPSIRNLPVEGISSLLVKVKCKHADNGCQALFKLSDLQKHLPECEYNYECLFDCRWKGKVSDLEMHAVNSHSNFLWECLPDTVVHLHLVHTFFCYCVTLFSTSGHLFWYTHEYDVVNKMFAVSVVQAKMNGKRGVDFKFIIEFETKDKKNKCSIESTVSGGESSSSKSYLSLANVVDSYKSDKVIPFKFAIHFEDIKANKK